MGNAGNAFVKCITTTGVDQYMDFETTAKTIVDWNNIEPWPSQKMVADRMRWQYDLSRRSPFNKVHVKEGMRHFKPYTGLWTISRLTRDRFVEECMQMLRSHRFSVSAVQAQELYDIFDSMDFDGNGELSVGEWAGGMTVFFKGSIQEKVEAVFEALDKNGNGRLSKWEMQQYFKTYVHAMTPPEAESLRPLLLSRVTNDLFTELDLDHNGSISSLELVRWSEAGNDIVSKCAAIIDHEVYVAHQHAVDKTLARERYYGNHSGNSYENNSGVYDTNSERMPDPFAPITASTGSLPGSSQGSMQQIVPNQTMFGSRSGGGLPQGPPGYPGQQQPMYGAQMQRPMMQQPHTAPGAYGMMPQQQYAQQPQMMQGQRPMQTQMPMQQGQGRW